MTALADYSDILYRMTGGTNGYPERIHFDKNTYCGGANTGAAQSVNGMWTSFWVNNGCPAHGEAPASSAEYPDNTTQGGLLQFNPTGGRQKWMVWFGATGVGANSIVLYDRLAQYGGLVGNTPGTTQSCSLALSGRYSGSESVGNEIWVEIRTSINTTNIANTCTVAYTDQDGNSATSGYFSLGLSGAAIGQNMVRVPLAAGDTGVRGITSLTTNTLTTGSAGNMAVLIVRRLATVTAQGTADYCGVSFTSSAQPPVEIKSDACLALALKSNGTNNTAWVTGDLWMCEA